MKLPKDVVFQTIIFFVSVCFFSVNIIHADQVVPGEYLVKFKDSQIVLDRAQGRNISENFLQSKRARVVDHITRQNISRIKIDVDQDENKILQDLLNDPKVEYIEPNYVRSIQVIPTNDTLNNLLWGLHNTGQEITGSYGSITGSFDADIDIPEAWTISQGADSEVIIAVIDNGVWYTHNDLSLNMWDGSQCKNEAGVFLGGCVHGYDFANNDLNPLPANGQSHGTHVAGTIAAVGNNKALE